MKRLLLLALCGCIGAIPGSAQQKCATNSLLQQTLNAHPEYATLRAHLQEHAARQAVLYGQQPKLKTTVKVKIPVVFHVILTQAQINVLGGTNTIVQRAIDQVTVFNEDFNAQNADKVKIPSAFANLQGTLDIDFGLAHRKPDGTSTNGVEIQSTTVNGFSANSSNGSLPKSTTTNGLNPWDPTRYLNIWIVNITEAGILGYCVPPSFLNFGYTQQELGVVIDFGAFGRRGPGINYFAPATNDRGRTGTHEVGHFFELEHIFGNGAGCPGSGDVDDLVADTPPQNDATYNSTFPNNHIPFPLTDACTPNSPGIMWMNFMDYPDDSSMYLFTKGQATRVQNMLATGILKSLTEHPEILDWPTSVAGIGDKFHFDIYPNPSTGRFTIDLAGSRGLSSILVTNTLGQPVKLIDTKNSASAFYEVDLTGASAGVYMVQCTFEGRTVMKKIVIQ
jgi:hypothetical protein